MVRGSYYNFCSCYCFNNSTYLLHMCKALLEEDWKVGGEWREERIGGAYIKTLRKVKIERRLRELGVRTTECY